MSKRYTAEDFANARFAEHPDGLYAMRTSPVDNATYQWTVCDSSSTSDEILARNAWVPVPTKPTITESEYHRAVVEGDSFTERLELLGFRVIPDPEPTNVDRLRDMHEKWADMRDDSLETFTEFLDRMGVIAPELKNN